MDSVIRIWFVELYVAVILTLSHYMNFVCDMCTNIYYRFMWIELFIKTDFFCIVSANKQFGGGISPESRNVLERSIARGRTYLRECIKEVNSH